MVLPASTRRCRSSASAGVGDPVRGPISWFDRTRCRSHRESASRRSRRRVLFTPSWRRLRLTLKTRRSRGPFDDRSHTYRPPAQRRATAAPVPRRSGPGASRRVVDRSLGFVAADGARFVGRLHADVPVGRPLVASATPPTDTVGAGSRRAGGPYDHRSGPTPVLGVRSEAHRDATQPFVRTSP